MSLLAGALAGPARAQEEGGVPPVPSVEGGAEKGVEEAAPSEEAPKALKPLAGYFVEALLGTSGGNGVDSYPGPNGGVGLTLKVFEQRDADLLFRMSLRGRYIYSAKWASYFGVDVHRASDTFLGGLEADMMLINKVPEDESSWTAGAGPFVFLEAGHSALKTEIGNFETRADGPVLHVGGGLRVILGAVTVVFPELSYARGWQCGSIYHHDRRRLLSRLAKGPGGTGGRRSPEGPCSSSPVSFFWRPCRAVL